VDVRDSVWVPHPSAAERHPGVVLMMFPDDESAIVVFGTSQRRNEVPGHVLVRPGMAGFKALGLTAPTYFCPTNVGACDISKLTPRGGVCPGDLYLDLVEVMQRAFADIHPLPTLALGT
jgi:hypothetical protein